MLPTLNPFFFNSGISLSRRVVFPDPDPPAMITMGGCSLSILFPLFLKYRPEYPVVRPNAFFFQEVIFIQKFLAFLCQMGSQLSIRMDYLDIHMGLRSLYLAPDRKSTRLNSSHGYISYA